LVANLAQAAADEIGANSLLVRVSAYFHDVGKLVKPEFFAENMQLQNNPHDDLPPSMSTLVIVSHVKEGVSLGMLHKLPPPIIRAIQEHHGTSLLSYFHYKAKSQLEDKISQSEGNHKGEHKEVDESGFRYQGPKPSSRESAILCLADAVEAASRTMEKKAPANMEDLVNEIINMRLEDGQLDECDLSLSELAEVRRSFVFTLMNMFHGRVPYPKDED
jgi:putative nucleotidyltransferase with HDIG domain